MTFLQQLVHDIATQPSEFKGLTFLYSTPDNDVPDNPVAQQLEQERQAILEEWRASCASSSSASASASSSASSSSSEVAA